VTERFVIPHWMYDYMVRSSSRDAVDRHYVSAGEHIGERTVSAEALTLRLHTRWGGRSFVRPRYW